ncbi:TPA: hypothetical protein DCX16_04720 [bacterium]|nr:hypothetical protein [bacterium]
MKDLVFPQKVLEISNKIRWLIITLILLGLQFSVVPEENWINIYLLLVITAIYNIIAKFLSLHEIWEKTSKICYAETVIDTAVITGIVALTGGQNSPFWVFFLIVIMFAGVYYSPYRTFFVVTGISILYIFVSLLSNASPQEIISMLSLKIPIFFAVCGMSVFLSLEIIHQGEALEIEKEKLKYILKAFHHNVVQIQKKNKVLQEVYNISIKIPTGSSLKEQLEAVCDATTSFLAIDIAGIWLLEKNNEYLRLVAKIGQGGKLFFKNRLRIGEELPGRIMAKKEPLIINDLSKYDPEVFKGSPFSCMGIPLIIDGEPLGVFICASSYPKEFNEDDHLRFLLLIGCRTSLSIKNSYLREEIERMAITDGLTGLYNYRYFLEIFRKELSKASRISIPLSILMIDIDNFREINEKYGRHIGNQLLSEIAITLSGCLRTMDFLARFYEENFVIILPEANKNEGIMVAERIRNTISNKTFIEGVEHITVSIGISSFPQDEKKPDGLLLYADKTLNLAKEQGGNRVIAWSKK